MALQFRTKFSALTQFLLNLSGIISKPADSCPAGVEQTDLRHLESVRLVVSNLRQHRRAIDAVIQRVSSLKSLSNAVGMAKPQDFFVVEFVSPKDSGDCRHPVFDVRLTVSPAFDALPENKSCADSKWSLACANVFQKLVGGKVPVTLVQRAFHNQADGYRGYQHGMTVIPGSDQLSYLSEYYVARNFKVPPEYPTRKPDSTMTLLPLLSNVL